MSRTECRVYIGNLPPDIKIKELEDLFGRYGKIVYVDLKNRRGPPFAFIEYEDPRDAEDAVSRRDGYEYDGYRLRVEFPRGGGPRSSGRSSDERVGNGRRRRGPPSRRSKFRVVVYGLPASGSWQDLKDHMRDAGEVCYTDVYKDGSGVVEFLHYEDMKHAVRKLDDSRFRSHEGETSYIRVKEHYSGDDDRGRSSRNRSYSPARRRRGSRSYSRSRSASRSRSRSRSRSSERRQ